VPGNLLYVMRDGKPHWSHNSLEEINPADIFDKQGRITRLGEGGIPSMDAVPDEARSVQPSHLGFMDPIRTPESFKVGVDTHLASGVRKGKDGRIYTQFADPKTGETVWKSPQDVSDMTVAFPGEMRKKGKRIAAMSKGRIKFVKKDEVDLTLPHFEKAMSPLGNMIPLKSTIKGGRVIMGSRMHRWCRLECQTSPVRAMKSTIATIWVH
jgi:DNA-directed RNA polymerase beta subunit